MALSAAATFDRERSSQDGKNDQTQINNFYTNTFISIHDFGELVIPTDSDDGTWLYQFGLVWFEDDDGWI